MIVEDDLNLQSGLRDLLELEGFDVLTASNSESGFELYHQQQPDFCILDVMLVEPNDGYLLCKKIRETNQEIPILMLSARTQEIDKVLGFENGADDYLSKPFGPSELIARIKAISKRSLKKVTNDSVYTEDNSFMMNQYKIEPKSLRAYIGNNVIELTLRDVLILKLLYDKAGEAVYRDDLFDYCWGRQYMPNSRSLDQHVSALRKKLETKSDIPPIIQTVRGVGYRFDPLGQQA